MENLKDNKQIKNLKVFSKSDKFIELLQSFGVVEKGFFEYKAVDNNDSHLMGEYFINFRLLTTSQEKQLAIFYWEAIEEFFGEKISDLIIVGVAMGSLSLPKAIQILGFDRYGVEYAYTEKRNGELGIFDAQKDKCKGKHILFIEDVCNNGTSSKELVNNMGQLGIKDFSILYGVHRGNVFLSKPKNNIYAMSLIKAPSYAKKDVPGYLTKLPLKKYKKI